MTLRRVYTDRPPPLYRTFFIIRHGQSKWNRAMARINLTGMLDRDHALTTEGLQQAMTLNSRWREGYLQDNCYNNMHPEAATMVPPMFDFARMDTNEELTLDDEDGTASGDSDSDGEGTGPLPTSVSGSLPKNSGGIGLVKLYDSFFTKRGSVAGVPSGDEGVKKLGIASPPPPDAYTPKGALSPMSTSSSVPGPVERRLSDGTVYNVLHFSSQ